MSITEDKENAALDLLIASALSPKLAHLLDEAIDSQAINPTTRANLGRVYIVNSRDEDGPFLAGVFSTKEKALAFTNDNPGYYVEGQEIVDEMVGWVPGPTHYVRIRKSTGEVIGRTSYRADDCDIDSDEPFDEDMIPTPHHPTNGRCWIDKEIPDTVFGYSPVSTEEAERLARAYVESLKVKLPTL